MGMFCDRCKESSNAKSGCKFILDKKKWKIEFAKNMCKGLIHEYQHKGKKQEVIIQLIKLEATNHESQKNET
jgi:hypothetical protein